MKNRSIARALLLGGALWLGSCGTTESVVTDPPIGTATPVKPEIQKAGGDGQSGVAGTALPIPLKVFVADGSGTAVSAVTVHWAVASGSGSVSAATTTSDATGFTQVSWTLGAAGAGTVTASLDKPGGSVTFTATGTTGPLPPGDPGPHEPTGYTRITARPFSALLEDGWYADHTSGAAIVSDASAPKSPSQVMLVTYPSGFRAGSSPVAMELYTNQHTRNYVSIWFKLSSNFQGESSATNKIFFDWMHGNPSVFLSAEGVGSSALSPTIRLQNVPDSREYLYPNVVSGAQIVRGQWTHIEILLVANTPGSSNGSATWWQDGVLIGDYRNVQYAGRGQSTQWEYFQLSPIWGGVDGRVSQTMSISFVDLYVSGAN